MVSVGKEASKSGLQLSRRHVDLQVPPGLASLASIFLLLHPRLIPLYSFLFLLSTLLLFIHSKLVILCAAFYFVVRHRTHTVHNRKLLDRTRLLKSLPHHSTTTSVKPAPQLLIEMRIYITSENGFTEEERRCRPRKKNSYSTALKLHSLSMIYTTVRYGILRKGCPGVYGTPDQLQIQR